MLTRITAHSLKSGTIEIPWALNSNDTTEGDSLNYHAYLFGREDDKLLSEICILPAPISDIGDCWNLSVRMSERSGIYSEIAKILSAKRINVLHARTATSHHSNSHALRLLIDCRRYSSAIDYDSARRSVGACASLEGLEWELFMNFPTEIVMNSGRPDLSISRNHGLWSQAKRTSSGDEFVSASAPLTIQDQKIILPNSFLESISRSYKLNHPAVQIDNRKRRAISIVDNDYLLNIFIYYQEVGMLECGFSFADKPGALANITGFLTSVGYNILASKAWALTGKSRMSSWFLIQKEEINDYNHDLDIELHKAYSSYFDDDHHNEYQQTFKTQSQPLISS